MKYLVSVKDFQPDLLLSSLVSGGLVCTDRVQTIAQSQKSLSKKVSSGKVLMN